MNKVVLIGNLTKEVETRTTQNDKTVANFTIAVQRKFKNANGEREADFIPVVAWGTTAEICSKYLEKGKKVAVSGSIQTRTYDAQDGSKRYITEVLADEVQLLSPKSDDDKQQSAAPKSNTTAKNNRQQPKQNDYEPMSDMSDIDEEEMPFN